VRHGRQRISALMRTCGNPDVRVAMQHMMKLSQAPSCYMHVTGHAQTMSQQHRAALDSHQETVDKPLSQDRHHSPLGVLDLN
jgi:hypothetical protein